MPGIWFNLAFVVAAVMSPLVTAAATPQPFVVEISAVVVTGGRSPVIRVQTNLPQGTVLFVSMRPPFPACYGQCLPARPAGTGRTAAVARAFTVSSGEFTVGPAWETNWKRPDGSVGLNSGRHVLEVELLEYSGTDPEPPNVRAIIGAKGEYMRGPLVGGCCFGAETETDPGRIKRFQSYSQAAEVLARFHGPNLYYARSIEIP